jgi:hypothetical protein
MIWIKSVVADRHTRADSGRGISKALLALYRYCRESGGRTLYEQSTEIKELPFANVDNHLLLPPMAFCTCRHTAILGAIRAHRCCPLRPPKGSQFVGMEER